MSGGHTPGPWMATRSLHDSRVVICTEHGHRIDVASTYAGGCGVPVEANARLIAAAPELYMALKVIVDCMPKDGGMVRLDGDELAAARAAIAKATGNA